VNTSDVTVVAFQSLNLHVMNFEPLLNLCDFTVQGRGRHEIFAER